jgi:hypothetical protein
MTLRSRNRRPGSRYVGTTGVPTEIERWEDMSRRMFVTSTRTTSSVSSQVASRNFCNAFNRDSNSAAVKSDLKRSSCLAMRALALRNVF